MCRRGNPPRLVAPGGVLESYGVPFAWGSPGFLGTVVIGVPRRVRGSPGTQGWPRCCAFAWLYGCAGPRVGAIGPHMCHEPGRHVVPLAGVVHGGGGSVGFRPLAEGDVRHGAGSFLEVAELRSKQPSNAERQGEPLPCGDPVDP